MATTTDKRTGWRNLFQIALRDVGLIVLFVAVALTALKNGDSVWGPIAPYAECVACGVLLIAAFTKRPLLRGFAVGALCGACISGEVIQVLVVCNSHPRTSTPECLLPLHELIAEHNGLFDNGWGGISTGLADPLLFLAPSQDNFMRVFHALSAIALGYLGGRIGIFTVRHRCQSRRVGDNPPFV